MRACANIRAPVLLENPCASMLWLAPPMKRLAQHPAAGSVNLYQCAFKARWRKHTKLLGIHIGQQLGSLSMIRSGRNGDCSFAKKPRIVLSGASASGGPLWTSIAQAYPKMLCHSMANMIDLSTADCNHIARLQVAS
eukprot:2972144-Heterocapsa_arctica.AAC.1